jgi:peptidase E
VLYGNGTSGIGVTGGMTDGQVIIGSSAGVPAAASIVAGANIVLTVGHNSLTISALSGSDVVAYTGITNANTPYNALSTDYYISCDVTAGVITVKLPDVPSTGRTFVIKDKVGLSATSNITITTITGAVTIDGATTFVMNTAYEAANLVFNGTNYEIW